MVSSFVRPKQFKNEVIVYLIGIYDPKSIDAIVFFSFSIIKTIGFPNLLSGVPRDKVVLTITLYVVSISLENETIPLFCSSPSEMVIDL